MKRSAAIALLNEESETRKKRRRTSEAAGAAGRIARTSKRREAERTKTGDAGRQRTRDKTEASRASDNLRRELSVCATPIPLDYYEEATPPTHVLRRISANSSIPLFIRLRRHRGAQERRSGKERERKQGMIVLGREKNAVDIVLCTTEAQRLISRKHAVIYYRPRVEGDKKAWPGWIIEDHSMNGVFINDVKRKTWLLQEGDIVTFGAPGGSSMKDGARLKVNVMPQCQYRFKRCVTAQEKADTCGMRVAKSMNRDQIVALKSQLLQDRERLLLLKEKRVSKALAALAAQSPVQDERGAKKSEREPGIEHSCASAEIKRMREMLEQDQAELERVRQQGEEWKAQAEQHLALQKKIAEELECIICKELIALAVTLPCAHSFCSECITQWYSTKSSCPGCGSAFELNAVVPTIAIDNAIEDLITNVLDAAERRERQRRIDAWRATQRRNEAEPDRNSSPLKRSGQAMIEEDDGGSSEEETVQSFCERQHRKGVESRNSSPSIPYGIQNCFLTNIPCGYCRDVIGEGTLLGFRILRHFTYKYYHASCFFKSVKDLPPLAQLQGFEELSAEDKLLAAQLCSAEAL